VEPAALEETLRGLALDDVKIECRGGERAFVSDRNDAVARALSGAIRSVGAVSRPIVKTGTSDMNVVGPVWGCPIAAYGPGDSALDHTAHERLSLEEFGRSVQVLRRAVETLAGELARR
jgi:LysW-gamma-L-lysine carboxypeptidase